MSKTVSAKCRITQISEFQAVGPSTANARSPYELRLCQGRTKMSSTCHIGDRNAVQCTPLKCIGSGLPRHYAHKRSMQIGGVK